MVTKKFWRQGEPFVWGTGLALSLVLSLTFMLLYVVIANGIMVFWPKKVTLATLHDGGHLLGEIVQDEKNPGTGKGRQQFKIGNRDLYGLDFKWIDDQAVKDFSLPPAVYVLERQEHGNFYGYLKELKTPGLVLAAGQKSDLQAALEVIEPQRGEVDKIDRQIAAINRTMEQKNHKLAALRYKKQDKSPAALALQDEVEKIRAEFDRLVALLGTKRAIVSANEAVFADANGQEKSIALVDIVRCYQPNAMSLPAKVRYYGTRMVELLFAEPRESNTEGGLFPAIFGTIMLIFLMSIFSFPLGVLAGIYLREYAKEGYLVKMVRIAVNNLAGIPSIVYGIFGLVFLCTGSAARSISFSFRKNYPPPPLAPAGFSGPV